MPLAIAFFDAVEGGDWAALRAMASPGMTIWHNHDQSERSLSEMLDDLQYMQTLLAEYRYENRSYVPSPDGAWLEHELVGRTVKGHPVRIASAVRIFTDQDGLVVRIREYFDTGQARPLLDAVEPG